MICAKSAFICIAAPLPAAAPMLRPGIALDFALDFAPGIAPGVAPALFRPQPARALKKGACA
ncbi:MAG: hypothetical protein LBJ10_03900 [Clostridiales bacterium]|nr:hypothetical protein [Clostridiales bacterium]